MIAVVVQCRLSSTRLPKKALLEISGKTLFEFTLLAMKKVLADFYYVACDENSYDTLLPIAKKCGFEIFAGPLDDVLKRFCLLQEKINADIIVRATADNPFLFFEAANESVTQFLEKQKNSQIDYFTLQGLPHGSGVEIFDAHSLLKAEKLTNDVYDREHVGPSFYNHRENFSCVFENASEQFYFPELRTTVDTLQDFHRAEMICTFLESEKLSAPFCASDIVRTCKKIPEVILYVPCVSSGKGTGHLRRALSFAKNGFAFLYIDKNHVSNECMLLLKEILQNEIYNWQVLFEKPKQDEFHLIVSDSFSLSKNDAEFFSKNAKLFLSLDEGSAFTNFSDYLLDVIPANLSRRANYTNANFIEMPRAKKNLRVKQISEIKKVLVSFGGEDPAHLTLCVSRAFCALGFEVSAIVNDEKVAKEIYLLGANVFFKIENLKEHLCEYDLVVTHYGLTAYEARCAGSAILLFAPTKLHYTLSKKYGFAVLKKNETSEHKIKKTLARNEKIFSKANIEKNASETQSLKNFIFDFAHSAKRMSCPVCQNENIFYDEVVSRTESATFRKCRTCKIVYMATKKNAQVTSYEKNYFFADYKKQYGKTYLEDFASIQKLARSRLQNIDTMHSNKGLLLDIGCAYGPFLKTANDEGWQTFGCDISHDAISYVKNELHIPSVACSIFDFESERAFGVKKFDCVTMWFVIEHFENLKSVLEKISTLVKRGGTFAFSTPSLDGVSAKMRKEKFFLQSPEDHFTIWSRKSAKKILRKFGFKIEKIISTGHHPERFPIYEKHQNLLLYKLLLLFSKVKKMGDTFEIYCRKIK